jgi:alpha-N-acetylglucosamine transferase
VECNKFKNGEDKIFEENLVKMYGREAVDVLVFLSNKLVIKFDYDKWIKFYSELFKQEKEKRFGC